MAQAGQRKCMCCGFFTPDHRNRRHQRYCAAPACRRASHAASRAAWLARPENVDYFRGPEHVARVRTWRAAHPGYSRRRRALQDRLVTQPLEVTEQSAAIVQAANRTPRTDLNPPPRGRSSINSNRPVCAKITPALTRSFDSRDECLRQRQPASSKLSFHRCSGWSARVRGRGGRNGP